MAIQANLNNIRQSKPIPLLTIEVIDERLQPQSQDIEYRSSRILPISFSFLTCRGRTSLDSLPPSTISGPLSIHPKAFAHVSLLTA